MKVSRIAGWLAVVALAIMPLAACSLVTAQSCVSWVGYDTPQDAFDDARVVLVGESMGSTGTVS